MAAKKTKKRVLLLGGTGAMGANLSKLLSREGWDVTVTSRSRSDSDEGGVSYARGNAHDRIFLESVLSKSWDAVVDFMVWSTEAFSKVRDLLLSSCGQYVYLSSYRVFADSPVIMETSPRLLDVCDNAEYLATDEYALAKARQEDLLRASSMGNWTIVRPAITYDGSGRFQLCTLESGSWLRLVLAGHLVPLAYEMLSKQTTMTWGGDVALLMSRLVGNPAALGEDFNVCTSRHQSWGEVAGVYRSVVPLRVREVTLAEYERAAGGIYQCRYDRMFDRVMDNTKILGATGMSEHDLAGIEERLPYELETFLSGLRFRAVPMRPLGRLDRLGGGIFGPIALRRITGTDAMGIMKYYVGRLFG